MTSTELTTDNRELLGKVEQFLYTESALLDRREFPEWLKLFAEDGLYWVPSGFDDPDPTRKVSLVYDNVTALAERVWRFEGGLAYAQQPASRTARLVSNIQITGIDEVKGKTVVQVQAKSLTAEFRRNAQNNYASRVAYSLIPDGDTFSILLKKVELINNDGFLGNLGIPL